MDISPSLIIGGIVAIVAAAILVFAMLGIKEKTYEEAIAEQRKMPDDERLFRRPNKPTKSKDKKLQQRSGKKVKEKKKQVKQSSEEEFETDAPQSEPEVHVTIKSEPEILGDVPAIKPEPQKKKKKEKVKPILINKEETAIINEPYPPVETNHFDQTHPKDDLSLRKLSHHSEDEPEKREVVKVEESVSNASNPVESSPIQQSKAKEKKKSKKQESNTALLAPVTLQHLSTLILKAELSPNERQILTDLLLNDYHDGGIDHSEWSEGMQMAKLKKQLAEKEEALANELSSSQALQSKLKELRNEYNEEKSKCRQYEETMMAKLNDLQTLQARFVQLNHERQSLVKEVQGLNGKLKEDQMLIRNLQENNQANVALQQEILNYRQQISQMDLHLNRLSDTETALKTQLHALSTSFTSEQQKNRVLEEDLRDALGKLDALKDSNSSRQELARKLEEIEREKKKIEDELSIDKKRHASEVNALLSEAAKEAQYKQSRLQDEIHNLTNKISALQSESDKHKSVADKLKIDGDRQKSERDKLNEDVKNLQNECDRLQSELTTATSKRTAGDGHENGAKDSNIDFINHETESKNKDIILEKLRLELESSVKTIEKLKLELNSTQTKMNSELKLAEERFKTEINQLNEEVEAQKTKNNDLRQKNWKAVEALSSTEKALEKKVLETESLVNAQLTQAQNEFKALLSRLLPDVKVDKKDFKDWLSAYEVSALNCLNALRSASSSSAPDDAEKVAELERQVTQLQGMVAHYKTIIKDTEGMLNRLQSHVEAEESRWGENLTEKQTEIDALKKELESLHAQVAEKETALKALQKELEPLKSTANENTGKLEALCNERDELKKQLANEQERFKEINKELVKVKSNLKIGHDSFEAEHKLRIELEDKLKAISGKGGDNGEVLLSTESVPVKLPMSSVEEAEIPKKKKKKKRALNQGNQTWQNGGDRGN